MRVCVCVCMYVCMYVCVCEWVCMYIYMYMWHGRTLTSEPEHGLSRAYIHVYIHAYVYIYTRMHASRACILGHEELPPQLDPFYPGVY